MRPTADIALKGMQANLLETIAPRVTDPEATRQIQSMAGMLGKLADEWNEEPLQQRQANEHIGKLVEQGAAALAAAGGAWAERGASASAAAADAPAEDGTMLGIYARQDALNRALIQVLEGLEAVAARQATQAALDARVAIYRFLRTA